MPVPVRGSWTVDEAVMTRWNAQNLSAQFKAGWPPGLQSTDQFVVLNDTEATPAEGNSAHPRPYCVYEKSPPITLGGHSGGDGENYAELHDVPIQFTVYADSKPLAVQYAKLIAAAFDRPNLQISPDKFVEMYRDPDFGVYIDDQTYTWVLQYRVRIEAAYTGAKT